MKGHFFVNHKGLKDFSGNPSALLGKDVSFSNSTVVTIAYPLSKGVPPVANPLQGFPSLGMQKSLSRKHNSLAPLFIPCNQVVFSDNTALSYNVVVLPHEIAEVRGSLFYSHSFRVACVQLYWNIFVQAHQVASSSHEKTKILVVPNTWNALGLELADSWWLMQRVLARYDQCTQGQNSIDYVLWCGNERPYFLPKNSAEIPVEAVPLPEMKRGVFQSMLTSIDHEAIQKFINSLKLPSQASDFFFGNKTLTTAVRDNAFYPCGDGEGRFRAHLSQLPGQGHLEARKAVDTIKNPSDLIPYIAALKRWIDAEFKSSSTSVPSAFGSALVELELTLATKNLKNSIEVGRLKESIWEYLLRLQFILRIFDKQPELFPILATQPRPIQPSPGRQHEQQAVSLPNEMKLSTGVGSRLQPAQLSELSRTIQKQAALAQGRADSGLVKPSPRRIDLEDKERVVSLASSLPALVFSLSPALFRRNSLGAKSEGTDEGYPASESSQGSAGSAFKPFQKSNSVTNLSVVFPSATASSNQTPKAATREKSASAPESVERIKQLTESSTPFLDCPSSFSWSGAFSNERTS